MFKAAPPKFWPRRTRLSSQALSWLLASAQREAGPQLDHRSPSRTQVQPLLRRDSTGRLLSAEEMIEAALQRNKQGMQEGALSIEVSPGRGKKLARRQTVDWTGSGTSLDQLEFQSMNHNS